MPQLGTRSYSESHTGRKGEGKKYMVIDMGGRGNPVELEHTVTKGMWEKVGTLLKEAKKVEH